MKTLRLTSQLHDSCVDTLSGSKLDDSHYDVLIEDATEVYKPNGELLLKLVKRAIPSELGKVAYKLLSDAGVKSKNRGTGAGNEYKQRAVLKDGTLSRTIQTVDPLTGGYTDVDSGIIGYYDRYARFPYARDTAYLQHKTESWAKLQPFIRQVASIFQEHCPERYAIQKMVADAIAPDWVIAGTPFSTITVNKNWQTAVHKDVGDLHEGFGVMAYLQAGKLDGGYLVLPKYRVAVKLESLDLILFDVHEWHGNTPIKAAGAHERVTAVFYLRENLLRCGSAEYEQERAKVVRSKGKLYDDAEIYRANKAKTNILARFPVTLPKVKEVERDNLGLPIIRLVEYLPESVAAGLIGEMLDDSHYDQLITESCRVFDPFGNLLLVYRKVAIGGALGRSGYSVLSNVKTFPRRNNRGNATGRIDGRANIPALLGDGKLSRQNFNPVEVDSGIIGYFNRESRFPYCRETAYLRQQPEEWKELQPFIRRVDDLFAESVPDRYAIQRAAADGTAQDFVINGTAFSTVTVNRDFRTAGHRDAGDLKEGFGVMACLRAGRYQGGYLVLPKFRIAVDMQSCDVLLFNVHEVHGNTPIIGKEGQYKRITAVFYYREKMKYCLSAAEEQERAKNRQLGTPLFD